MVVAAGAAEVTTLGLAIGRLLPARTQRTDGDLRVEGKWVFELSKPGPFRFSGSKSTS